MSERFRLLEKVVGEDGTILERSVTFDAAWDKRAPDPGIS